MQANNVAEPSRMFNAQTDGELSVDPHGRTNTVASEQSGNSTQKLPGISPNNVVVAAATTRTSAATPSAVPAPPTPIGDYMVASRISGDSTQNHPGHSPNNAEMAADTA